MGAYRAGQHFGEGNVLSDISRVSTVTADTDVLLYEIDKEDLTPMLAKYPDLKDQLEQSANKQAEKIEEQKEATIKKRKSTPKPQKKSPMQSIQTFFTGIFEQAEEEKDEGEEDK